MEKTSTKYLLLKFHVKQPSCNFLKIIWQETDKSKNLVPVSSNFWRYILKVLKVIFNLIRHTSQDVYKEK